MVEMIYPNEGDTLVGGQMLDNRDQFASRTGPMIINQSDQRY